MSAPDRACPDYPNECLHPWAHARTYAEVKATQAPDQPPIEVLRAAREWAAEHRHQQPDDRMLAIVYSAGYGQGRDDEAAGL